ncbi:hypothetical protein [Psychroserpens mesophilus]|uniref:hypothetical protein n=1 Tax=Psychroserpens mesophilus TaxID=325473 RepID=UPI003D65FCCA
MNGKNILKGFDLVAKELGNSRNVCRKYYVHPILVKSYNDDTLHNVFTKMETTSEVNELLTPTEASVIKILKDYKPLI